MIKNVVTLYHGTARQPFEAFGARFIGRGWEGNSSLGVWLSTSLETAAFYMREGCVLTVESAPLRLACVRSFQDAVLGGPDLKHADAEIAHLRYAEARERLVAAGYDGVWCELAEDDMQGAVCIFEPGRLRITGSRAAAEVEALLEDGWETAEQEGLDIDWSVDLADVLARIVEDMPDARLENPCAME